MNTLNKPVHTWAEDPKLLALLLSTTPNNVALGLTLLTQKDDAARYARVLNMVVQLNYYPDCAQLAADFLATHLVNAVAALEGELDFLLEVWENTVAEAEIFLTQIKAFEQHIAAYQYYFSIQPAYGAFYNDIIQQYSYFELYPQAAAYCSRAIYWAEEKAPYWHKLSQLLYEAPDAKHRQLLYLRKAVQSNGATALHCYNLALLYWEDFEHPDEALRWAQNALNLAPEYAPAHHLLSTIYHHQGQLKTAHRHAREAVLLDTHHPAYQHHYSEVHSLMEAERSIPVQLSLTSRNGPNSSPSFASEATDQRDRR